MQYCNLCGRWIATEIHRWFLYKEGGPRDINMRRSVTLCTSCYNVVQTQVDQRLREEAQFLKQLQEKGSS